MDRYDVVLYGATGFTGAQTAHYFDAHVGTKLSWAIAGRSRARLEAVRDSLTQPVPIIVADAMDDSAIDALVECTQVVLSTAGPFALFGENLLRACVTRGVDYVDITGETVWIKRMIDRYHDRAVQSGARIIPCSGFDSVPSDLGTWLLVDHLRAQGLRTRSVKAFHRARGGVNGGTIASLTNMMQSPERNQMDDPLLLNPDDERSARDAIRSRDPVLPTLDADLGRWVAPFFMGPINTRVVRRSAALSRLWQQPYGDDFHYQEYMDVGAPLSLIATSMVAMGSNLFGALVRIPGANRLIEAVAPAPGQGPSEETMDDGFFECLLVAHAHDGTRAWARIADRGDPGNRATVKMVCESALCLARDPLSTPGGVLTPASAMGGALLARLREAGMTWVVEADGD